MTLWNRIINRVRRTFGRDAEAIVPAGSQRSRARQKWHGGSATRSGREDDREILDTFVRDPAYARAIFDLCRTCPEAATAIEAIKDAVLTDPTGDEVGFQIVATNPAHQPILDRLLRRVIGGTKLERAIIESLEFGNSYGAIVFEKANTDIGYRIQKIAFRPPWEMYRHEDDNAILQAFEQREHESDTSPVIYDPIEIIHWRFRVDRLYGRSLFHESLDDWFALQQVMDDLVAGSREVGINALAHEMPQGKGLKYRLDYAEAHAKEGRFGAIANYYLDHGAKVSRVSSSSPDLTALISTFQLLQRRIVMKSSLPPYLLGLTQAGAQDMMSLPTNQFARKIASVRMAFSAGLRQICDTELACHGIPNDQWDYSLIFPKTVVNVYEDSVDLDTQVDDMSNPDR